LRISHLEREDSHKRCRIGEVGLIDQKYSWTHINQVACALRFFYGITLGQKEALERIVIGKEPEKLPPVLNREEIARFLAAVAGLRNRVALTTAYAAGLRVGDVVGRKVSSIDSERMLLHIEDGKGGKDRYSMLSPRLLTILRAYWKRARPSSWLFSRTGARRSCEPRRSSGCLSRCQKACPNWQACDGPFASA
jgi:integrase